MYLCIPMGHGKIQIQALTHGYQDCLDPDVFQNVMSKLVQVMEYVQTSILSYLDDLLILKYSSIKYHLINLEMVLVILSTATLRLNIFRSKFFAEQIEYLVIENWITRQGIQSIRKKVDAIINIKAPKSRKEGRTTPVY
jgi:hypothetical protein